MPSQAVPLFFVKFSKLIGFLRRSIEAGAHLSVVDQYILGTDATFFVVDFFTGNRASDLGPTRSSDLRTRGDFYLSSRLLKLFGVANLVLLRSVLFPGLSIICLSVTFFPSS